RNGVATSSSAITVSLATVYFVELKRVGNILTLSVFSDAYATHISGSPVTVDVTSINLTGFTNVQIGENIISSSQASNGVLLFSKISLEFPVYLDFSNKDANIRLIFF